MYAVPVMAYTDLATKEHVMNLFKTIQTIRKIGYPTLKYLGDIQAAASPNKKAVQKRIARRIAGKATGRFLGWLIK